MLITPAPKEAISAKGVNIIKNGVYKLPVESPIKITVELGVSAIFLPPNGYTIYLLDQLQISNGSSATLYLDFESKTYYLIAPVGSHNQEAGLQGGKPGQYYHLTEDEYNNAKEILLQGHAILVGQNLITHNLGLIPRVITFTDTTTSIQRIFTPNLISPVNDPLNSFNVYSTAVYKMSIYIRAYGTTI